MTIGEALSMYLLQLEADGRSVHTIIQYKRHVGLLARWLGEREIGDLTHQDLARFLVSPSVTRQANGATKRATTMNALRSSLRTFFAWQHAGGFILSNPARLVRLARCGAPPPRALSKDEQSRLLAVLAADRSFGGVRDHALIHLMLASGIRLGSALALDVEDCDLERGELVLRKAKGDRTERVFLSRAIRDHLASLVKGRAGGPLFIARHGGRLGRRQLARRLAQWARDAGIQRVVSPHQTRHSFATDLYRRTGDIALVQRALTHRSIASTLVYARCDENRLRDAMG